MSQSVAKTNSLSGHTLTGVFALSDFVAAYAARFASAGGGDLLDQLQNFLYLLVINPQNMLKKEGSGLKILEFTF